MIMRSLAAAVSLLAISGPAYAATYVKSDFSAGIFGGNANVRDPLRDPYFPSDTFTGSFVYDTASIPGSGTGFTNVFLNSYPDAASIPAADAFSFSFGSRVFTLADDPMAMVQYNNGNFNGFVFNTTFSFEGANYLFSLNGGSLKVVSEADPFGQPYINGYINIGNSSLTGSTPYTPTAGAVPEPTTWALMILGFAAVGGAMRSRRKPRVTVSYA